MMTEDVPVYETEEDRDNQSEVFDALRSEFPSVRFIAYSEKGTLYDGEAWQDYEFKGFVEVKCMKVPYGDYKYALCPSRKTSIGSCKLVVRWSDGIIGYVDIKNYDFIKSIKRSDRPGPPEPHAFYSLNKFRMLHEYNHSKALRESHSQTLEG